MKLPFHSLYNTRTPVEDWPSLKFKQVIPNHCRSCYSTSSATSYVGLGMIKGIVASLMNISEGAFWGEHSWFIELKSFSSPEIYTLSASSELWVLPRINSYMLAVAGLMTALSEDFSSGNEEIHERWELLLKRLALALDKYPPYTPLDLHKTSRSSTERTLLDEAMMSCCDALYFYMKRYQSHLDNVSTDSNEIRKPHSHFLPKLYRLPLYQVYDSPSQDDFESICRLLRGQT